MHVGQLGRVVDSIKTSVSRIQTGTGSRLQHSTALCLAQLWLFRCIKTAMSQNQPSGGHEHASPIPVDPEFIRRNPDVDSALGDCDVSIHHEPSLHGSVLQFREIHGRTFHNFGSAEYWGPNDNAQNDSLDLHHQMLLLLHEGKLFRAPVVNPQAILDVGTGTGLWAM